MAKFLHFEFWFWHGFWFFAIYKSLNFPKGNYINVKQGICTCRAYSFTRDLQKVTRAAETNSKFLPGIEVKPVSTKELLLRNKFHWNWNLVLVIIERVFFSVELPSGSACFPTRLVVKLNCFACPEEDFFFTWETIKTWGSN